MRRRRSRRSQLVGSPTRAKNEIHAVLIRRLKGRPPVSDLFGVSGRIWLADQQLPADERETIDGCLRHVDFLASEIAVLDKSIARAAIDDSRILRLMTVPATSVITASTFVAAIGDIRRFNTARQLVGCVSVAPTDEELLASPGREAFGRLTIATRPLFWPISRAGRAIRSRPSISLLRPSPPPSWRDRGFVPDPNRPLHGCSASRHKLADFQRRGRAEARALRRLNVERP